MMRFNRRLFGGVLMVLMMAFDASVHACETITSWNALVTAVEDATDFLRICTPFDIVKPESERLVLEKRLTMVCVGASDTNKCTLRGAGNHFRIGGADAEIMIDGFAFYNATQSAVRVHSTATKRQRIRKSLFVR